MLGTIGVLNVGAGDTKLVFDKDNPADCIRAARIVRDMLRRGYALLIEVEEGGKKTTKRVLDFKEDSFEYIIADFDPVTAAKADTEEKENAEEAAQPSPKKAGGKIPAKGGKKVAGPRTRAVSATSTRGVAVARTAGG